MQMTEIAKALSENARVLILDEPTSALSAAEADQLMEILRELKSQGVTCIYISHKLEEFFRITDTVSVLRDGKLVTTQATKDLTWRSSWSDGGSRDEGAIPERHRKPGEVFFKVKDLHAMDPANPAGKCSRA